MGGEQAAVGGGDKICAKFRYLPTVVCNKPKRFCRLGILTVISGFRAK